MSAEFGVFPVVPLLGLLDGEPPPLPPLLLALLPPPLLELPPAFDEADDEAPLMEDGEPALAGLPEKTVLPRVAKPDALSASLPTESPRLVPALTAPTTLFRLPIPVAIAPYS